MKKTLAAAITSALVIGVASTTFAAANPFSDVPRDHWSYDAVARLAQAGVIEGYGDNTFRGDSKITRYEMAQMVAKAMTKDGLGSADKATIDRLGVEYADELNNLGVRVANLEKKSDNVQFSGLLRLDGSRMDRDQIGNGDTDDTGEALLRLDIKAKVNEDWNVIGRLDASHNMGDDSTGDVKGKYAYAEGPLLGANAKLGRFGAFDAVNLKEGGLLMDTEVNGAQFEFGDRLKTTLTYGRLSDENYAGSISEDHKNGIVSAGTSDYMALQFAYAATNRLDLAAGYYNLKNRDINSAYGLNEDSNGIWSLGFDYRFNPDLTFGAIYADSNVDSRDVGYDNSDTEKSYSVQLTYKGAKSDAVGSYGAWLAYRQIGNLASIAPTYDGVGYGQKGFEIGVDYMIDKNILTKLVYFDGEDLRHDGTDNNDANKLFGRVEFQF